MALGDIQAVAHRQSRENRLAYLTGTAADAAGAPRHDLHDELEAGGVAAAVGGRPGVDAPQRTDGGSAGEDVRVGVEGQPGGEVGGQGVRAVAADGSRQGQLGDGDGSGIDLRGDAGHAETQWHDLQDELEAGGVAAAVGGRPGIDAPQTVYGGSAGEDVRVGVEGQPGGEVGGQGVHRAVAADGSRQDQIGDGDAAGVGLRGDAGHAEMQWGDLYDELEAGGVAAAAGGRPGIDAPQIAAGGSAGEDVRGGVEGQPGGEVGGQGVRAVKADGQRQGQLGDGDAGGVDRQGDAVRVETQ